MPSQQEGGSVDNRPKLNAALDELVEGLVVVGIDPSGFETAINTVRTAIKEGAQDKSVVNRALDKIVQAIASSDMGRVGYPNLNLMSADITALRQMP